MLAGPAGTGKTTLTRVLAGILREEKYDAAYTALTGRAASIARERSQLPFTTLHAYLYQFDDQASADTETGPKFAFKLRSAQLPGKCAVLVDESSMLGDTDQTSAMLQFGSGNPLRDLLRRLFSPGMHVGKLILIGDQYQLPPVGTEQSTVFMPDEFAALCQKVLGGPPANCSRTSDNRVSAKVGRPNTGTSHAIPNQAGAEALRPLDPSTLCRRGYRV